MKKLLAMGVVFALLAVVVVGAVGAKGDRAPAADPEKIKTLDILFDGYCDGINVTWDTLVGVASGGYWSTCATCPTYEAMGGTFGKVQAQGPGLTLAWADFGGSPPWIHTVVRMDHTWTHYDWTGAVFNSGTWSFCPKEAAPGAGRSTIR